MSDPQYVAVPIPLWSAVIQLLMREPIPMERVQPLVSGLQQCATIPPAAEQAPDVTSDGD